MNDHSLPKQDCGESDSGRESSDLEDNGLVPYVIRFTPLERYSKQELIDWLDDKFDYWVLGEETKPQIHYHVVVDTDVADVRALVREFLHRYWPPADRGRGWGNKQYNCSFADKKEKAISYAIKDKVYEFRGFDEEYIEYLLSKSFQKNSPGSFKAEFLLLCQCFNDSTMSVREYMKKFCLLKAKYNQMVNVHHAHQYGVSALLRREPEQVDGLVDDFLSRQ